MDNINNNESISEKTIRNSIFNTVGFIWPVFIAFFTIPIIIGSLGVIDYGYYIFIGTLLSLFGLIDLGVSTAINKFFAEKIGEKDFEGLKKYVGVSKFILLSIAILGSLFLVSASCATLFLFNGTYSFLAPTIFISSLIFFISVIQSIVIISLQANQRFDISSKLGIFTLTLQQFGLAAVAFYTKNITLMFTTQLITAIISLIIGYYFVNKIFPIIKTRMIFEWGLVKKFYKYGITTFFVGFSNSLLTYFDRLLIPIILGPKSLTYYTVPGTISTKIPGFSGGIGSIVFSMASNFQGAKDETRQKKLYEKSSRLIILISTSMAISTAVYAKEILGYWIDFDIAENSYLILIILCATSVLLATYNIIQSVLLGTGKFKELAITTASMLIINVIGLFVLLPVIGILGAAVAYFISVLPVLILKVYIENKYFYIKYSNMNRVVVLIKYFVAISIVSIISIFVLKHLAISLLAVIILFGISNLIFLFVSFILGLIEKDEVEKIKRYLIK